MRAMPKRMPVATSTSGSVFRSSARAGLRPPKPKEPESTTKSPVKDSSMAWSIEAVTDAAAMAMSPTRPTPIIRAAAVDEVRLGLRTVFSLARRPVMPRKRATGQPMTATNGPTRTGPRMVTPRKTNPAPTPTISRALSPPTKRPWASSRPPTMVISSPARIRTLEWPDVSRLTARMAATGGMRDARNAGNRADTEVTTNPRMIPTRIVPGEMTRDPSGRSTPKLFSSERRPLARRMPRTMPNTEPTRATKPASTSTELMTWRRDAPMARSRASSRPRWATRIPNVL